MTKRGSWATAALIVMLFAPRTVAADAPTTGEAKFQSPSGTVAADVAEELEKISDAVALMIKNEDLRKHSTKNAGTYYRLIPSNLPGYTDDGYPYCSPADLRRYHGAAASTRDEDLSNPGLADLVAGRLEATAGFCTAFRVGRNKIGTAGHCALSCETSSFVFGFKRDRNGRTNFAAIPGKRVYSCKDIFAMGRTNLAVDDWRDADDWALLETDRDIDKAIPTLSLRRETDETLRIGDEIVMLGHPSGRALVTIGSATVTASSDYGFLSNLRSSHGASGGPVFAVADLRAHNPRVSGVHRSGSSKLKLLYLPSREFCQLADVCEPGLEGCDGRAGNHAKRFSKYVYGPVRSSSSAGQTIAPAAMQQPAAIATKAN